MVTAIVIVGFIIWVGFTLARAAGGFAEVAAQKGDEWSRIDREQYERSHRVYPTYDEAMARIDRGEPCPPVIRIERPQ